MVSPITVTVKTNAKGVARALSDLEKKQLPFAAAKGLTILSVKGKTQVQHTLPKEFTIRSKRVVKGIRNDRAEKRDWPHPKSKVGTMDDFMVQHALGTTKKPIRSRALAVPGRNAKVRTKTGKVRAASKPRALLKKRGKKVPFLVTFSSGKRAIVKRTTKKRLPLLVLFTFTREAKIDKRWELRATVADEVRKEYGNVMDKTLFDAVLSAKKKARLKAPR